MLKRERWDRTWLRLVDVPKALAGRTYGVEDSLVIEVADVFCPWNAGRYELTGGPNGADCRETTKTPDLALSSADLAVAYLGGNDFTPLARAGRVEELSERAIDRANAMFATRLKPWAPFLT